MRKKTNWTADAVIHMKPEDKASPDLNGSTENYNASDMNQGWEAFPVSNTSLDNSTGQSRGQRRTGRTWCRGNARMIIIAIIAATAVIGIAVFGPAIAGMVEQGVVALLSKVFGAACITFFLGAILMAFGGVFFPGRAKAVVLGAIFVAALISQFVPSFYAVLELFTGTIFLIIIIFYLLGGGKR